MRVESQQNLINAIALFLPAYKSTLPQDLSIILACFKISTCDYELKKNG